MNSRKWMSTTVVCLFAALALTVQTNAQQIVNFDAPGADTTPGDFNGTIVAEINALGVIVGYYYDANSVSHGFLRSPDGKFTTFDPPGVGNTAGFGTIVHAVNLQGVVAGGYYDSNIEAHPFVRNLDGTFTTFVVPGACTTGIAAGCHGSGAWNINLFGTIVGAYEDTSGNFVAHTYIRYHDGELTTFAVPGSSMEVGQGTLPAQTTGLNQWGAITGLYYDANNTFHGYLRSPDGKFTDFEAPGADLVDAYYGTFPESINDMGAIAGYYIDSNSVYHGFLRSPKGKITAIDAPGADTTAGDFNGTFPVNINSLGLITGSYVDTSNVTHGFTLSLDGKFTTIDVPGAGGGAYQGTFPVSANLEGAVTGYYIDASGTYHGFVRTPARR